MAGGRSLIPDADPGGRPRDSGRDGGEEGEEEKAGAMFTALGRPTMSAPGRGWMFVTPKNQAGRRSLLPETRHNVCLSVHLFCTALNQCHCTCEAERNVG